MTDQLPALSAGVLAVVGALLSYRQSTRANAAAQSVETVRVDAAAYDRARSFDREATDRIRLELERAEAEIAGLRQTLSDERIAHAKERAELMRRLDRLERVVYRLRRRLREAGIDVGEEEAANE
jgi:hypothetical protein